MKNHVSLLVKILLGFSLLVAIQPHLNSAQAQADFEWIPVNEGLEGDQVDILWRSPGGTFFAGGGRSGLFRSDALGEPWEPTSLIDGFTGVITADSSGNIVAGTSAGIFVSPDEGLSWEATNLELPTYSLAVAPNGNVFAGTTEGVFRLKKDENEWKLVGQWMHGNSCSVSEQSYSPVCTMTIAIDSMLYIAAENVIYKSKNGNTWDCFKEDESGNCTSLLDPVSGQSDYVSGIRAIGNNLLISQGCDVFLYDTANQQLSASVLRWRIYNYFITNDLVFAAAEGIAGAGCQFQGGLYISGDNGRSWSAFGSLRPGALNVLAAKDASWVCQSSGDGVDCSEDGGDTWWEWDTGLTNTEVTSLFYSKAGSMLVGTLEGYQRKADTSEWVLLDIPVDESIYCTRSPNAFTQSQDGTLLTYVRQIFKTRDVDSSWVPSANQESSKIKNYYSNELSSNPSRPVCAQGGLDIYVDSGCPYLASRRTSSFLSVDDRIYVGGSKISYSDDNFDTVNTLPVPINFQGYGAIALASDSSLLVDEFRIEKGTYFITRNFPDDIIVTDILTFSNGIALVTTNQGIFRSEDNGISWAEVGEDKSCYNTIIKSSGGEVFVDAKYVSADMGLSWRKFNEPPAQEILSMSFDKNGILYAGSFGQGIFRSSAPVALKSSSLPSILPDNVHVYPNPTSGSFLIEFSLETHKEIRIELYDALGRKKKSFVSKEFNKGNHKIKLALESTSAGVYLLGFEQNNMRHFIPITLVKQ